MATPHASNASACGQNVSRPTPLRKIPAENHDEIAERNQIGDRLDRIGHVLDRKHEARQVHHRYQEKECRRHHRLLLRVGDGRDEQPQPKGRQQIDEAHAEEQPEAAAQWHLKPEDDHHEHDQHVDQPDDAVRQQLADDQLQPAERRDVQLLERPNLALAHDRHRRQVRRDDQQAGGRKCQAA